MPRTSRAGLIRRGLAAAALLLAMALGVAGAQAQTVAEIQKRGKILVAIDLTNPPYGTMNDKMEPDGFEVALAKLLAKAMSVQLEIVPVTSANRIPFILTNRCDILMAGLTITPPRATQVWFSSPYVISAFGLIGPKSRELHSAADLKGLKIGVVRSAFGDPIITKAAPPGSTILRYDDLAATMQAQLSGQVDVMAENYLVPGQLNALKPGSDYETKFTFTAGYWAIALRQDQTNLLQWLNSFIFDVKTNGDLAELHTRYLKVQMPGIPSL